MYLSVYQGDGAWTLWGPWSDCPITCGVGTVFRTRSCTDPVPVYGGAPCQGDSWAAKPCFTKECPGETDNFIYSFWGKEVLELVILIFKCVTIKKIN